MHQGKTLFNTQNISKETQQHISRVYLVLTLLIGCASLGCFFCISIFNIGRLISITGFICCFLYTLYSKGFSTRRIISLVGLGFFQGCLIGPLIEIAHIVDQSLIIKALTCTSAIFISFSMAALLSKRRSFMFLGGILSSTLMMLCLFQFFGLFLGWGLNNFELGIGLLVFCGYVIYDTQLMVEKVEGGDNDVFKHSVNLFIDFAAIFVRILVILIKASLKKD